MPKVALTAKAIQGFRNPESGRDDYYDVTLPGLIVRVSASGRKSWSVSYWKRGKRQRVTLGDTSLLSLSEAREQARTILRDVKLGLNPAAERREKRQATTFADLANEYLERHAWPYKEKKSAREDERRIQKLLIPRWGTLPARELRKRQIVELLDEINDAGKPFARNRLQSLISKIYNHGIERDAVGANPAAGIKRQKEHRRKRALSDDELRKVLPLFKEEGLVGLGFRLLLLTAQRPSEVFGMLRSEVDGDVWKLPAERCKSRRSMEDAGQSHHVIPLSSEAMAVLRELRAWDNGSGFVFPSRNHGKPLLAYLKPYRRIKAKAKLAEGWIIYDLKTTAITGMAKLRFPERVLAAVANHVPQDLTRRHYSAHDYAAEKREALAAWGEYVGKIDPTTTAKVVQLHRQ